MRTAAFAVMIFVLATGAASAATPDLWAITVGDFWSSQQASSYSLSFDPFDTSARPFLYDELLTLMDASYDPINSKLYMSGWGPNNSGWGEQNTIAVYDVGPGGITFDSYSNADMGTYYWLGGIAYLEGSLYAVSIHDHQTGNEERRALIRVDNPGTASQAVTQIGDFLGGPELHTPFALCVDNSGDLLASFGSYDGQNLYSIDPITGDSTLFHTFSTADIGGDGAIEALEFFNGNLIALTSQGSVYEIDLDTYDIAEAGSLPENLWTCLVTVPEPGIMVMMAGGVAALVMRRRKGAGT